MGTSDLLLRDAAVPGSGLTDGRSTDVRMAAGRIVEVGAALPARGETVVDAAGGALLPGLHDHHCHLLALAAARDSVPCGPPSVGDADALAAALRGARPSNGWLRGVGYHESVARPLDRDVLDRLRPDVPVRVQDRSGALWTLNSAALTAVGVPDTTPTAGEPAGLERDLSGRATGRCWRLDGWLRERIGSPPPGLAAVSAQLASYGVTGVTDATPALDATAETLLSTPDIRQRVMLLGSASSAAPSKIVVRDDELPTLAELSGTIAAARPRPVALHCVTRVALALTLVALQDVGTVDGDRIEHAAVVPPALAVVLGGLALTVVTQPVLVAARGDEYLAEVDVDDRPWLWPFASLLDAGVPVGCSTDAPYGDPDPWAGIRAAAHRRAPSGRPVAETERVSTRAALRGFLTRPDRPGGAERRVRAGADADLVLLHGSLAAALADPDHRRVRMTIVAGRVVFGA